MKASLNAVRAARGESPVDAIDFLALVKGKMKALEMDEAFLSRSVNEGFSGGEKKRNEILQLSLLEPALAVLDETDSGLDIDALRIVADGVNRLRPRERAVLAITLPAPARLLVPDRTHVLIVGHRESGDRSLALGSRSAGMRFIEERSRWGRPPAGAAFERALAEPRARAARGAWRAEARDAFLARGLPTTAREDWRFTPLAKLEARPLGPTPGGVAGGTLREGGARRPRPPRARASEVRSPASVRSAEHGAGHGRRGSTSPGEELRSERPSSCACGGPSRGLIGAGPAAARSSSRPPRGSLHELGDRARPAARSGPTTCWSRIAASRAPGSSRCSPGRSATAGCLHSIALGASLARVEIGAPQGEGAELDLDGLYPSATAISTQGPPHHDRPRLAAHVSRELFQESLRTAQHASTAGCCGPTRRRSMQCRPTARCFSDGAVLDSEAAARDLRRRREVQPRRQHRPAHPDQSFYLRARGLISPPRALLSFALPRARCSRGFRCGAARVARGARPRLAAGSWRAQAPRLQPALARSPRLDVAALRKQFPILARRTA
jgi:energy-coupling factor transporter ATP-binding protein EcfA2